MTNVPPLAPAEELRRLDQELLRLDAHRAQLLHRRAWLLNLLNTPVAPPPRPGGNATSPPAPMQGPSAQNVLLALGGILLAVAALAFTLVGWGQLGIAGRSAALALVTAAALAAPAPLVRRGLVSTAESVVVLGLVLTVLDAYALHRVAFSDADGTAYTAAAASALAVLWTSYGLVLPRLRTPLPAALLSAQLPLPLLALSYSTTQTPFLWALLATAAPNTLLALWKLPAKAPKSPAALPALPVMAAVLAWLTGSAVLLAALLTSPFADSPAEALRSSGPLLGGAALALAASLRRPQAATALVAGLASVAAVGGVVRPALSLAWTVPLCLGCALALLALSVRAPHLPRPVRHGLARSSAAVGAGAVLTTLPVLMLTLTSGPLSRLVTPWRGLPPTFRETVTDGGNWQLPWQAMSTAPLVLLVAAAALALFHRRRPHPASAVGTVLLTASAFLAVPVCLNLPYVAGLALYVVVAAASLALLSLPVAAPPTAARTAFSTAALVSGAVASVAVSFLAAASRGTTFAVLGALLLLWLALAVRTPAPVARALSTVVCAVYAMALACAWGAALGLPVRHTALLALAVPALVALLAVRVRSVPMEIAGAALALVPVGLAAGHLPTLSLVLALCGVIAAGTAVRPERRAAGWAAGGLFVASSWARLAASDIGDPEAYTLPASILALTVGVLRRRRDPQSSSWLAYGPGLSMTLLPSLVAAWADAHWQRPLLLGVAALVITLLGAGYRLGAPLLLGAVVLSLVSLHELAPYAVQVVGVLPRWLPPALAGLLLLAVGATYEQRLRDARWLRARLGRLQ
jgi:hypothetical protein